MSTIRTATLTLGSILALASVVHAGPVSKTKDAVDPDCTIGKAAKGAAQRSTVGVGNRCKPGETARDAVGLDNGSKNHDKNDGPLKRDKD